MQITFEIKGSKELNDLLKGIPKRAKDAVRSELKEVMKDLKGKSQDLAPVETGDLKGSAYTDLDDLQGEVGFTEPYALRQHEELEYKHPKGGQAKYLEQPYKQNRDRYIKSIGEAVRKVFEK